MDFSQFISENKDGGLKRQQLLDATEAAYQSLEKTGLKALKVDDGIINKTPAYLRINNSLKNNPATAKYFKGNVINTLEAAVVELIKTESELTGLITKNFDNRIRFSSINYMGANIIRFVDGLTFFAAIIPTLVHYLTGEAVGRQAPMVNAKLMAEYQDYIFNEENMQALLVMVSMAGGDTVKKIAQAKQLKDIEYTVKNAQLLSQQGKEKDFFVGENARMFIVGDVFVYLGQMWNQWQRIRYDRAQVQIEAASMNIALLEESSRGATPERKAEIVDLIKKYNESILKKETIMEEIRNG